MKRTTLTIAMTTLLSIGAISSSIAQSEPMTQHKAVQIKMDKADDGQATLEIKQDGDIEIIEFTQDEMQDADLMAQRLAHLDEKTRTLITSAMQGIDVEVIADGDKKVMIMHRDGHGQTIANSTAHAISTAVGHKIIQAIEDSGSERIKIKIGSDKAPIDILKRMIESGQFSQEQLDAIEAKLNAKRAI